MALHKPLPSLSDDSSLSSSDDTGVELQQSAGEEEVQYENPTRIHAIYQKLHRLESLDGYRRFLEIPCLPATRDTIKLVHSPEYFDRMLRTMAMTDEELRMMTIPNDLYFCRDTFLAARIACGGVVECVNAVTDERRKSNRAIAIVRPPGHHATRDEAMGKSVKNKITTIQSCDFPVFDF
jgi:histone deacetylase 6